MKLMMCLLLATLLGCQPDEPANSGPEETALAVITGNSLPVDGCEESVRIQTTTSSQPPVPYKPTPRSLPILQNALSTLPAEERYRAEKPVRIRFIKTGRQVDLECGWGSRQRVEEIEILEISER